MTESTRSELLTEIIEVREELSNLYERLAYAESETAYWKRIAALRQDLIIHMERTLSPSPQPLEEA